MKSFIITIIFIILISSGIYSQIYDRHHNPNYMWTTFDENFSGTTLDRNVWIPTTHF
jgi:hypothetical protein